MKNYDHSMILDYLRQLRGELAQRQLELEGRPVPRTLVARLAELRGEYGQRVLPPESAIETGDSPSGGRRRALARQTKHVGAVCELLDDLFDLHSLLDFLCRQRAGA
jgi:hypothetical protein